MPEVEGMAHVVSERVRMVARGAWEKVAMNRAEVAMELVEAAMAQVVGAMAWVEVASDQERAVRA